MIDELRILVEHVLLTSRNGHAACADENCGWTDEFHAPRRDSLDPMVPMVVRVSHARHQLDLLKGAAPPEPAPRGGW